MTKQDLQDAVDLYKSQISIYEKIIADLREEKIELQQQVGRLQDAIIAIRAPEAYRDQRVDRLGEPEQDLQKIDLDKQRRGIERDWLRGLEEPMFKSGEDVVDLLGGVLMTEAMSGDSSLHGNDES